MHFPCPGQDNELAVGREKQIAHNEDNNYEGSVHGNRTLTTIQSIWRPSMIHKVQTNDCSRIRPALEAAQAGVYCAPESHADITRLIRIHTTRAPTRKVERGAPMRPPEVGDCARRTKVGGAGAGDKREPAGW